MKLKLGARLLGLKPEVLVAMLVARDVIGDGLVITACVDGTHKPGSLHYAGLAFDFRTHDLPNAAALMAAIKEDLGPEFDVLFEDAGTDNEHGHIEYQPKL